MSTLRIIKVFIASPGDLTVERRAFKDTVDLLNAGFGRGADVQFVPLGWEDALSQVGRRSQSVINRDVDACDIFVLVMWRRWGQEAPDAAPCSSYTEEEFYRALTRFENDGALTIFVFFKHIDPGQIADPGEQLKKVLEFRKKLEQSRNVLYRSFDDEEKFKDEIDRHLVAFAKGELVPPGEDQRVALMPDSVIAEIIKVKAEAKAALERAEKAERDAEDARGVADAAERVAEAKAIRNALALAEQAAQAALEGKIEEARQDFAKALDGTTNLHVLSLGYEFFLRVGELDEAERLMRRSLAISGPEVQSTDTGMALGNLGVIHKTRGDLDKAEEMHKKSLAIHETLGHLERMAHNYGNLGVIHQLRDELDKAEEMHKKSLAIERKLGRLEGIAADYGNLGLLYLQRHELDKAEEMHKMALSIYEKLGRLEGMAINYGNLGVIYKTRGDLDKAEEMLKQSLALAERVGSAELIASAHVNVGSIAKGRGGIETARGHWKKALSIRERCGMKADADKVRGQLDTLPPPPA
jgi:tetratricopeptide (TPR) repeat protein